MNIYIYVYTCTSPCSNHDYPVYYLLLAPFTINKFLHNLGGGEDYRESSMYWHFGNRVPSFYKVGLDVMCLMGLKGFRYPQSDVFWDI